MLATTSPFPFFPDLDGRPLDAGYIYFGEPHQDAETHPVPVYWDRAGTQPAAQPLRTLGGYIARNGTPAQVFTDADYSLTVLDKKRRLVFGVQSVFDYVNGDPVAASTVVATDGQTLVDTGGLLYTPGINSLQVVVNGLMMRSGADYAETSPSSVTFTVPLAEGDEVVFRAGVPINRPNSGDASLIPYVPAGAGALTTNVQAKLRESISADDFGGDLQAAVDYIGARNGGDVLLGALHTLTATLDIPYSNVRLVGRGADEAHNTGSQGVNAGTALVWAGVAGGTMVRFRSPEGASAVKQYGGGARGIYFNSGATTNGTGASRALEILSRNSGVFENLFFREFQSQAIRMGCVTTLFDPRDPQKNRLINCASRNAINLSGGLLTLDGDTDVPGGGSGGTAAVANVSLNHFENLDAQFFNGDAVVLNNSDHNFFWNCRETRIAGGTGNGLVFNGSNNGTPTQLTARKNVFLGWSGGSSIVCRGTPSFTHPSTDNVFLMLDDANNTPFPTVEAGATVHVTMRTNGIGYYPNDIAGVFSNSGTLANAEASARAARTRVVNESMRVSNRSSDHARFERPTADNSAAEAEWLFRVDASGHFGIARTVGAGEFQLLNNTRLVAQVGFNNSAPLAKPAVTGSRGGNAALASLLTALANYGLITDSTTA